jgi:hypothetical protein
MQVLKGPSKAILNGSRFDETILIFLNNAHNDSLQPISQKLSENFYGSIQERNRPEV